MTTVTGRRRRPLAPDAFADITDADVLDIAPAGDPVGSETSVIFDGDLTEQQVAAVLNRMDSTDPADEADRATTRALRGQLLELRDAETLEQIVALLPALVDAAVAGLNYRLGEV